MQYLFVRMSASGSCIGPLVQDLSMKSDIATLPAFRAMDTHDLRRRLHFEIKKHNFTCIPRTRHALSPQKVALQNQKMQFHLHSASFAWCGSEDGTLNQKELQAGSASGGIKQKRQRHPTNQNTPRSISTISPNKHENEANRNHPAIGKEPQNKTQPTQAR